MAEAAEKIGKEDVEKKFIVDYMYYPYNKKTDEWPRTTILLSTVRIKYKNKSQIQKWGPETKVFKSDAKHAEVNFFDKFLSDKIQDLSRDYKVTCVEVDLVQNYSPCGDCADEILKFIEGKSYCFTLTIKFANFYYHQDEGNIKGLKKLLKNDIKLELLQGEDTWEVFLSNEKFIELRENEKEELLKKAASKKRKDREEKDVEIMHKIKQEPSESRKKAASKKRKNREEKDVEIMPNIKQEPSEDDEIGDLGLQDLRL